jgi:probable F420-dependent oxidoreductase
MGHGGKRRLRFGVIGESIRSVEQLVTQARRAEELGYSTLQLRDHLQPEPFGDQLAPLAALQAAAAATSTLRIGTLVLGNDFRHPAVLAKEAATVDLLSGRRFELGIGAGWSREEYERAGLPFDSGPVRVSRLEESVQILRRLLAGETVTFTGQHYSVSALRNFPRPPDGVGPPILIGAGSKRMVGIAGRLADIVGILPKALPNGTISAALSERSPEAMVEKIDWVREAAGQRFGQLELSIVATVVAAEDHLAAAERLAHKEGWPGASAEQVLEMPSVLIGSADRIADQIHERRERYGLSYFVVSDQDMAALAPAVQLLA